MRDAQSIIWFLPAYVVTLGIFLLSTFLAISFPVSDEISFMDKLQHGLAYFVLIIAYLIAMKKTGRLTPKKTYVLLISAVLYGFLLELIQYLLFPNRYFEWMDAMANSLGVVVGFVVFKLSIRE